MNFTQPLESTSWAGRGQRGRNSPGGWRWQWHCPLQWSCVSLAASDGCFSQWRCSRKPPDTSWKTKRHWLSESYHWTGTGTEHTENGGLHSVRLIQRVHAKVLNAVTSSVLKRVDKCIYLVMAANMLVTAGRHTLRGLSWHITTRSRFRLCRYSRPDAHTRVAH